MPFQDATEELAAALSPDFRDRFLLLASYQHFRAAASLCRLGKRFFLQTLGGFIQTENRGTPIVQQPHRLIPRIQNG